MKLKIALGVFLVILIAIICVLGYALYIAFNYNQIADDIKAQITDAAELIGTQNGQAVGTAIGTYHGITQGWAEGAEDGKQAGLSAADTTAEIKGKITPVGKLEVVKISTNNYNVMQQQGGNYVELQKIPADITYTVDLEQVEISLSGTELTVLIPEPEVDVASDPSEMEVIATEEYSTFASIFNGTSEEGITASVNSWNEEQKEMMSKFEDPESVMYQNAEKLAKQHVEELIHNIRVNDEDVTVTVAFKTSEEGA